MYKNNLKCPRFEVKHVFIDLDGTVIEPKKYVEKAEGDCYAGTLIENLLVKGKSREEAERLILGWEKVPMSTFLDRVDINRLDFWREMVGIMRKHYHFFPDGRDMIRKLHDKGFSLYTATANPSFSGMVKLGVGDLACDMRSPYFKDMSGGWEIHPNGKNGPEFFESLLGRMRLSPKDCVVIGDNPKDDLLYGRQAGINNVILPRRDQKMKWKWGSDGGLYVKSLDIVPDMLLLKN